MDFVRSYFGKMQVLIWKKSEAKSVQLVRVAFFQSDFLQIPYLSLVGCMEDLKPRD
jgi:hypothetical protein